MAVAWVNSLRPGIKSWTHDGYTSVNLDYTSIPLVMESTEHRYEEYMQSSGANIFRLTAKGTAAPSDTKVEGDLQRLTVRKYTEAVEVYKEDVDDDRYRQIESAAKEKGQGAAVTYNYWGFHPMRAGFTGTVTYADGQELYSTSHTRADGGTAQSNASSTGIPLTYDNLNTGIVALRRQLTDKGMPTIIGDGDITLVVDESQALNAATLVQSERRAGSPNNDFNYYKGRINVLSTKWLGTGIPAIDDSVAGSATQWQLITNQHKITFLMRQPLMLEEDYNAQAQVATWTVSTRFVVGPQSWEGTWGSKGDNQAYSG